MCNYPKYDHGPKWSTQVSFKIFGEQQKFFEHWKASSMYFFLKGYLINSEIVPTLIMGISASPSENFQN